jgi:2-polyprenyl-6-methoxyphenol hydroxylase-like FAD-dependent oxidoreductase
VDDVVIVGAGPAGLATAATLQARGIDATILDVAVWGPRSRYDRLRLHTIRSLSSSGLPIPHDWPLGGWTSSCNTWSNARRAIAHASG